jgi:hypothetical protein
MHQVALLHDCGFRQINQANSTGRWRFHHRNILPEPLGHRNNLRRLFNPGRVLHGLVDPR